MCGNHVPIHPSMPFKTFAQGGATVLAMDRPADYRRVIVERTNDRMLAEKRQGDLCRGLPLEQLAERLQPVNAVRKGRFTGIFQGPRRNASCAG